MADALTDVELKELVNSINAGNLTEGYQDTPLQEFIAVLTDYEPERDEKFDRIRIQMNFSELEVILTAEPYPFPVAQFAIPFSKSATSGYGFFMKSIDKLIPNGSIASLLGKKIRMQKSKENFGKWKGDTEDRIRDCWHVLEIVGEITAKDKGKSAKQVALGLAAGKTPDSLQGFYQEAFKNPVLKGDKEIWGMILNKTFIPQMLEAGELIVGTDKTFKLPGA